MPASAALKDIEGWRREGDSWRAVLLPSSILFDSDAKQFGTALEIFKLAAGVVNGHRVAA